MTTLDSQFQEIYDTMMGYGNFVIVSGNTIINGNTSINSNLCVLGSTVLNNNTTVNSNLNVLGNLVVNNTGTILSSLYISNNSIINNNLTCAANIYVSGNTYFQNNLQVRNTILINSTTIGSTINISDFTILNQGLNINNIGALNNSLTLDANTINIGNTNSSIFFYGTSTYIASSQLILFDKLISLNAISNSSGIDLGGDCGIEILGTSGLGYIKTSLDASRYIIRTPLESQLSYIAIQDNNNNINISGSAYLSSVSIVSSLTVSGITTFNNITALSSLIVNNNASFYGNVSTKGILNVSGNTLFIGSNTIFGNINVSGNVILQGSTSILSNLNVGKSQIIQGNTTYLGILNVLNNSILQNTTISSNITSQGLTMFNNLVTINSNLNISNNYICNNNISINSQLYVSGYSIINNSSSINSSLNVLGNTIINSNITIYSNLNLKNYILLQLSNYPDNTTAKNNGIPIYGFYRTGGIVKIRLNDVPPIIYLSGNTSLSISYQNSYTDPGAYSVDYVGNTLPVYIYSLGTGLTNILSNNILVSGNSTLITQTSILNGGYYNINYQSTDIFSNIGYTTRLLYIIPPPMPIFIFSGGNITTNYWCLTNNNVGQPWVGLDIYRTVFNPTLYNWSLGLSISFQINFSQFYHGLFTFRGSGSGSNRGLYHLRNQDSSYIGIDPNPIAININLTGNNSLLFSFPNDGSFTIWKNGTITYQSSTSCNVFPTTPTGPDVYIGISQIATNYLLTGTITNIKIWNQPMVWTSNLFN